MFSKYRHVTYCIRDIVENGQIRGQFQQNFGLNTRVSEPACFGAAPGIFYPEQAPAPGKRVHNVGIFLTDYELSKIRSNTCTSKYI